MMSRTRATSACEKGSHWEDACALLQGIIHQLLAPDVLTLSAAVSACEKGEHWEEAFGLLQEMMQ